MTRVPRNESGFTLAELMVVMVLAGVVAFTLLVFYFNSQGTWLDASAKALAQRDATTLLESIASRADSAGWARVSGVSGDTLVELFKSPTATLPYYGFCWRADDQRVHQGPGSCFPDQGPVVASNVDQFSVVYDATQGMINLVSMRVRSTNGDIIVMQSSFKLHNAQ
jgi:prepilin-type N-terminal cleavage/methylation domain-containing protein